MYEGAIKVKLVLVLGYDKWNNLLGRYKNTSNPKNMIDVYV